MRRGKIELFKGVDGQWYFRVKGGNGRVVAQSEGYVKKFNAERGVVSLFAALRDPVVVVDG